MVAGSFASTYHGHPRATQDVDIGLLGVSSSGQYAWSERQHPRSRCSPPARPIGSRPQEAKW
jgi:hypothetical protein